VFNARRINRYKILILGRKGSVSNYKQANGSGQAIVSFGKDSV
jgi:hypothetical protein